MFRKIGEIRVHDFRTGKCGWGHNIHGKTFEEVPKTFWEHIFGRPLRRLSFMVHCQDPMVGDDVMWTSPVGDKVAKIYKIEGCSGVDDMYTFFVEVLN